MKRTIREAYETDAPTNPKKRARVQPKEETENTESKSEDEFTQLGKRQRSPDETQPPAKRRRVDHDEPSSPPPSLHELEVNRGEMLHFLENPMQRILDDHSYKKLDPSWLLATHPTTGNSILHGLCGSAENEPNEAILAIKKILSSHTIELSCRNSFGKSPLMIAIEEGNERIVKWLTKQRMAEFSWVDLKSSYDMATKLRMKDELIDLIRVRLEQAKVQEGFIEQDDDELSDFEEENEEVGCFPENNDDDDNFAEEMVEITLEEWNAFLAVVDEPADAVIQFLSNLNDTGKAFMFDLLVRSTDVISSDDGLESMDPRRSLLAGKDKRRGSRSQMLREKFHFRNKAATFRLMDGRLKVGSAAYHRIHFNETQFEIHTGTKSFLAATTLEPGDIPVPGLSYRIYYNNERIQATCVYSGLYSAGQLPAFHAAFAVEKKVRGTNCPNFLEVKLDDEMAAFLVLVRDAKFEYLQEA